MKVVYNNCFGGFSISEAGMRRYAELAGLTLYPEVNERWAELPPTYWLVPKDQRTGILSDEEFLVAPLEARAESNRRYGELTLNERGFRRTDPLLVQVVEELGKGANGAHADLAIADVPSGQRYRIDEYDGNESVMTIDSYEWEVAP